jgi:signal transduction histidine kinase
MTEQSHVLEEVGQLQRECDCLRDRVRAQEAEIDSLSAELRETNQGVVALYAELDDKAEQLRNASELKSRFLSYMSHEFRVPLGSIQSMARLLLDEMDGPLSSEQQKQIGFIRGSATELSEMVNDLLDLAKIEAGRITVSPAWFDMIDLFSALRGMFKPILASRSVSLFFDEPADVPRLYTDDRKLSQILRNFISNALKFTEKGQVRVSAQTHADKVITFAVADTGIGIAQEHLALIFEDYVQVESDIQRRVRGTGLGLALSRKLAGLLGGKIHVESEIGVGSTFHLTIPQRLFDVPSAGQPETDTLQR